MDWNQVLGWGSPIGLGAFFWGFAKLLKALMFKAHHMDMKREMWDKKK